MGWLSAIVHLDRRSRRSGTRRSAAQAVLPFAVVFLLVLEIVVSTPLGASGQTLPHRHAAPTHGWDLIAPSQLSSEPLQAQRHAPLPSPLPPDVALSEQNSEATFETISDAWELALRADNRLAAHGHEAAAAENELASRAGQRWPSLRLQSGYDVRTDEQAFRFDSPAVPLAPTRFPFRQRESVQTAVVARLPIYTGGRIPADVAAARHAAEAAGHGVDAARLDLLMEVAVAYLEVLRASRTADVRKTSVRTLEAHARNVRHSFEQGLATRNEVLTAEVRASTARQALVQSEHALDLAWSAYNRLTGRPFEFRTSLAEPAPPPDVRPLDELTSLALERRPEVAALEAESRMRQQHARRIAAERLPQVSVEGGYLFEENRYQSPQEIGYLGVRVDWNAVDGGQSRRQSQAEAERALATRHLAQEQQSLVRLQVHRAWLALREALSRMTSTATDVSQAEENLRVAEKRYEQGMVESVEVLDAEELYSQSRLRYFSAVYDAVMADLQLDREVGILAQRSI